MQPIQEDKALRKLYWRFERALRAILPRPEARVLGAISGGRDSVVLAALLAQAQRAGVCPVLLGHVNHGLRPEADAEETLVRELAADLELELQVHQTQARVMSRQQGWSLEQAARVVRLGALAQIAADTGCEAIATVHHLDDQAETVLIRILRGVGPRGLGAMAPSTPLNLPEEVALETPPASPLFLIRPLLEFRRSELEGFRERAGLPWAEDSSNEDRTILRNQVRLDLLPHLEGSYNPRLAESLAELARWARLETEPMAGWAGTVLEEVRLTRGEPASEESLILDAVALMHHPPAIASRVLWMAFQELKGPEATLTGRHMTDLLELLEKLPDASAEPQSETTGCSACRGERDLGEVHLPGKIRVRLAGGRLFFETHRPHE